MRSNLCPHLINNTCEIASSIALEEVPHSSEVCRACLACDRPSRINLHTISLANSIRPLTSEEEKRLTKIITDSSEALGTQLAKLFSYLGISEKKDCACPGHKDILNLWTSDYIRINLNKVIRWLEHESKKRRLPFSKRATKFILLSLISEREENE